LLEPRLEKSMIIETFYPHFVDPEAPDSIVAFWK
jgi:hypothetical protein